ncbi:unnamed protein product [Pipistrellus nathusii]|uniref:Uncharacterized protein n=1 Tax=Pipistrellus nathusii TaxID=59473 RepID=A0ABN9Z680_PIPNA
MCGEVLTEHVTHSASLPQKTIINFPGTKVKALCYVWTHVPITPPPPPHPLSHCYPRRMTHLCRLNANLTIPKSPRTFSHELIKAFSFKKILPLYIKDENYAFSKQRESTSPFPI